MSVNEQIRRPPKSPPWVNRLMAAVLRSPVSRLLDRGMMLLTVHGRRSGRAYTFPVQYLQEGTVLWVLSGGGAEKTWWRNLVDEAGVEVWLRRQVVAGWARAYTHDEEPTLVEERLRRYVERFPGTAKRLDITPGDPRAYQEAAARSVIVRVDLG